MSTRFIYDEQQMTAWASLLSEKAISPTFFALWGDLGAGKTTWARAFIRAWLHKPNHVIVSPTFSLMQPYTRGDETLWHVDLYRLSKEDDVHNLGLIDLIGIHTCVVEWPDRMESYLPRQRVDIRWDEATPTHRQITLCRHGD